MPQKGFEAQPISSQKWTWLQSLKSKHFTRSGGQVRHKKIILGIALSKIGGFFASQKIFFMSARLSQTCSRTNHLKTNFK